MQSQRIEKRRERLLSGQTLRQQQTHGVELDVLRTKFIRRTPSLFAGSTPDEDGIIKEGEAGAAIITKADINEGSAMLSQVASQP